MTQLPPTDGYLDGEDRTGPPVSSARRVRLDRIICALTNVPFDSWTQDEFLPVRRTLRRLHDVQALRVLQLEEGSPAPAVTGAELTQAQIVARLTDCADARREVARSWPGDSRERVLLEQEADTLDAAAKVARGELGPLYGLLPSWRWTEEMERQLGLSRG